MKFNEVTFCHGEKWSGHYMRNDATTEDAKSFTWEGLSLSRVLLEISIFEIQSEAKIHSSTGSEMDGRVVLLVSGASATLHVPLAFIFLNFPFILHACPVIFLPFVFMSLRVPFRFFSSSFQWHLSCFHLPFICMHFPSCCIHVLPFPFKSYGMTLWLSQETECNKWLSLSYR